MNRTLRSVFGLLLAAALFVLPARVEAHPPHVGSLETIVDFDASLLEMPESIAGRAPYPLLERRGESP